MEIERAALGRVAHLGDLYNVRTDAFCGGRSIFAEDIPENLVETTFDPCVKCELCRAKHRSDKCKNLGLQAELELSVLTMDIPLQGSAQYLDEDSHGEGETTLAFVSQFKESVQKLNVECEEIEHLVAQDSIAQSGATHFVAKVTFGLESVFTVSFFAKDIQHEEVLVRQFSERILATLNGKIRRAQTTTNSADVFSDVAFRFFTDAKLGRNERTPKKLEEYGSFLRNKSIRLNGRKQKTGPIVYTLVPLHSVQRPVGATVALPDNPRVFDVEMAKKIVSVLDIIEDWKHELDKFIGVFEVKSYLFNIATVNNVNFRMKESAEKLNELRKLITRSIEEFRCGKTAVETIQKVLESGKLLWKEEENFLKESFSYIAAKLDYLAKLEARGVYILPREVILRDVLRSGDFVVFAVNLSLMDDAFRKKSVIFERLRNEEKQECILIDTDVNQAEGIVEGSIAYYSHGICVEKDLCKLSHLIESYNVIKFKETPKRVDKKPHPRVGLEVVCPKSFSESGCDKTKRQWLCYECGKLVEYGFGEQFYCECGESLMSLALWCCQDHRHGMLYEAYKKGDLKAQLEGISKPEEFNVLLIGETGGGKSTWINSIANYVIHATFKAALGAPLTCLIPCSFSMQQNSGGVKRIMVGEDGNESFETGQSSTQKPKTYAFMYKSVLIRLIDVPGVADTRGPEQDKKNFDLILQELRTITELHAICVLMLPDVPKLTLGFKYCINELFTHLHKDAAANIVFCFTKTRQTFYQVGSTLQLLETFLDDFAKKRSINIPLVKDRMYCFDNEAFRLLCAIRKNVEFTEEQQEAYQKSWDISAKETTRFLDYVIQRKPHRTREMLGLNEARRIIVGLTGPLADITNNINVNLRLLKEEKEGVEHLDATVANLEAHLNSKQAVLQIKDIDCPRTVCASQKCIGISSLPDSRRTFVHYKQTCHENCNLKDIQPERYPDPRLKKCVAMSGDTCKVCGCKVELHLHVRYLTELTEIAVVDKEVEQQLKEEKSKQAQKDALLKYYDDQVKLLEARHKRISEICVNFGAFLDKNSILPYNDVMTQYLQLSIKMAEQEAAVSGKTDHVSDLENYLKQYEEELNILKSRINKEGQEITLDDVLSMKEELFSMNSKECNIAAYLKAAEEAEDMHFQHEDHFFEVGHRTPAPSMRERYVRPTPHLGGMFGAQNVNADAYYNESAQQPYYYEGYNMPQESLKASLGGYPYSPGTRNYGVSGSQQPFRPSNPALLQQRPSMSYNMGYYMSPSGDAALPPQMKERVAQVQDLSRLPTSMYQRSPQAAHYDVTAQAPYEVGKQQVPQEIGRLPTSMYQRSPQAAHYDVTAQAPYEVGKQQVPQEIGRSSQTWDRSRDGRSNKENHPSYFTSNTPAQQQMNRPSAFRPISPEYGSRGHDAVHTSRQPEWNAPAQETLSSNMRTGSGGGYNVSAHILGQHEMDRTGDARNRRAGYEYGPQEFRDGAVHPFLYQSGGQHSASGTNRSVPGAIYAPQQPREVVPGRPPYQNVEMQPAQGTNRYPPGQQVFEQYTEYPPEAYRQLQAENWSPASGVTQPEYGNFSTGSASRDEVPTSRRKQHSRSGETEEGKDKKSGGWFPFSWRR